MTSVHQSHGPVNADPWTQNWYERKYGRIPVATRHNPYSTAQLCEDLHRLLCGRHSSFVIFFVLVWLVNITLCWHFCLPLVPFLSPSVEGNSTILHQSLYFERMEVSNVCFLIIRLAQWDPQEKVNSSWTVSIVNTLDNQSKLHKQTDIQIKIGNLALGFFHLY